VGLLSSIELPHWLIIAGAILIAVSFIGLALTRNKEVAMNPDPEPHTPRQQIPPVPRLLDSNKDNDKGGERPAGLKAKGK
jgi:hypothetical protein